MRKPPQHTRGQFTGLRRLGRVRLDERLRRMDGFLASRPASRPASWPLDLPASPVPMILMHFWNVANDKDVTFTPKFYLNENPLLIAVYRQDFLNSFLTVDTGFTQGYKKTNKKKTEGSRTHFFSKFIMNLIDTQNTKSSFEMNLEKVSNDTYLKVYDVESTLVDSKKTILENKIDFFFQKNDFYFGLTPSVYEDTTKIGNKRHEIEVTVSLC